MYKRYLPAETTRVQTHANRHDCLANNTLLNMSPPPRGNGHEISPPPRGNGRDFTPSREERTRPLAPCRKTTIEFSKWKNNINRPFRRRDTRTSPEIYTFSSDDLRTIRSSTRTRLCRNGPFRRRAFLYHFRGLSRPVAFSHSGQVTKQRSPSLFPTSSVARFTTVPTHFSHFRCYEQIVRNPYCVSEP